MARNSSCSSVSSGGRLAKNPACLWCRRRSSTAISAACSGALPALQALLGIGGAAPARVPEVPRQGHVHGRGDAVNYNVGHFPSLSPMLDNLTARLARIVKQVRGEARLTESNIQDALREVR